MSRIMNWSGRLIDPFDLKPEDFENAGLQAAVTLSRIQRFWGQLKVGYTVAQHCLSMVERLRELGADGETMRWGLAHEIFEALGLGDIPTPIKRLLPDVKAAENRALELFAEVYGLTPPMPQIIKEVDRGLLVMEAEALMPGGYDWRAEYGEPCGRLYDLGASEERVRAEFLLAWQRLFGRI